MSLRSDDPNAADVLLGLNCRGSLGCGIICKAEIETLQGYVSQIGTCFLHMLKTHTDIPNRRQRRLQQR